MYNIDMGDDYTVPEGMSTTEQCAKLDINMSAESYAKQRNVASKETGIQAALDKYNQFVQPAE